jgi:hypothetical protein
MIAQTSAEPDFKDAALVSAVALTEADNPQQCRISPRSFSWFFVKVHFVDHLLML